MNFYMDESGQFTASSGISVVCVLSVPTKHVRKLKRQLVDATKHWPKVGGELKSGSINSEQLTELVDILYQHQAVLFGVVMDVASETPQDLERHQKEQAEGITRHLTDEHQPTMIESCWKLRRTLEAMPRQLYVQCVAMTALVCDSLELTAMFFAQRLPRELAQFNWIIDAKNPLGSTTQEKWWKVTFGPIVESRSARHPFKLVDDAGFQYKHMNHRFRLAKKLWRPDGSRDVVGLNVRAMVTDNVEFVDSRSDILIQATDVLAGYVRRLCNGKEDLAVAHQLGRLQIARRDGSSVGFIALSRQMPDLSHLSRIVGAMKRAARAMFKKG